MSNLYRRKLPAESLITNDLARAICELATEIKRDITLLIDRRGRVITVSVGDAAKTEFSERNRESESRLRALRLIHTHLKPAPLSKSDLTTLFLHRLDAILAIDVENNLPKMGHLAHLTPPNADLIEEDWRVYPPQTISALENWDVLANTTALEEELSRQATSRETKRQSAERAILIHVDRGRGAFAEESINELAELAKTAGAEVVLKEISYQKTLKPGTAIGHGRLEELTSKAYHLNADLLIFDQELSAAQAREIENLTNLKIIDRTQLILDIFAQHAAGPESKLQVELAQLRYMLPRLIGQGIKLSRLGGQIGTRGPGETKLELDRRRIKDRISFLDKSLEEITKRQHERRKARLRSSVPIVGIIGYTNAGKSTLLNALTKSDVLAEDKLFATLAPTSRRGYIESSGEATTVIFTDTVGFIRDLPNDLKRAFRATLAELADTDLLLHVIDIATPGVDERFASVTKILDELKIENDQLVVLNKSDQADSDQINRAIELFNGIPIAAATGFGLDKLKKAIKNRLANL